MHLKQRGMKTWTTCFLLVFCMAVFGADDRIQRERLPDGVEHSYCNGSNPHSSRFFQWFQQVYNVDIPTNTSAPFGASAALLVGVSRYKNLSPQLPYVTNDLVAIRDFLISKSGFDDVYVVRDEFVNRDLIEKYIKSILPERVGKHGRILFYFSGHGADGGGRTGYMQFADAAEGQLWGPNVLPITAVTDWSNEVQVKHMLFLLDCCASGLGFSSKAGGEGSARLLLNTLSGDGSRCVLTAGTVEEKTFALAARESSGNGVFTRAFISSFDHTQGESAQRGILTIADVFAAVQKEIASFSAVSGNKVHPRLWQLQEADYRGTFVFPDPRVESAALDEQQAKLLNIPLKAKGADVGKLVSETGIIQFTSYVHGSVLIDGVELGRIASGDTRQYLYQKLGKRRLELKATKGFVLDVEVKKGEVVEVFVTPETDRIVQSPIATYSGTPKGSFKFDLPRTSGDVYIDGLKVGYLHENEQMLIENLTAGEHEYIIRPKNATNRITAKFVVEPGKTTQTVDFRPSPPTNLRIVAGP